MHENDRPARRPFSTQRVFGFESTLNRLFIVKIMLGLFQRVLLFNHAWLSARIWFLYFDMIRVVCYTRILRQNIVASYKNTMLSSSIIPWRPDSLRFTVREVSRKLLEKLFTGLIQSKRSNLNLDWVFICSLPLRHSTCDDDIYPAPPCNTRT